MDELTPTDFAFLILLKIANREISNTELNNTYGVRLVGESYARLNGLNYVSTTKVGSTYHHTLLTKGVKLLDSPITVTKDEIETKKGKGNIREQQLWAALLALHNSRHEQLRPARPATTAKLEEQIRAVYTELATEPGAWVSLSRLRPRFGDVSRSNLDMALERLLDSPDVELEPEDNQKTLKVEERRAAVRIGGEDRHLLSIGMR